MIVGKVCIDSFPNQTRGIFTGRYFFVKVTKTLFSIMLDSIYPLLILPQRRSDAEKNIKHQYIIDFIFKLCAFAPLGAILFLTFKFYQTNISITQPTRVVSRQFS